MHIPKKRVFHFFFHLFVKQVIVYKQWIVQIHNIESCSVFIVRKARFSCVLNVSRIYVIPVERNICMTCQQHSMKLWFTE